ncbi:ATP-binding protein [Trinickia caryophylli]|uniref:Signal transduction histidine-protein kinase/phosphatase MprB n=1 Tax=Trinickia caryophylli TaxID=28094 RepID=A0A1X7E8I9_TRICW|nr:ATP-binding protein [Trinickia caryophylli]PMS13025.1 HAMP domain-containing protein [Trinickia caryophylli]TRX14788.1 HAMP domain-containing protein [Trinickia caryophylli]WQE14633.1 ATP-binding protein [Trinickia caryophylli]SMF29528.1 two-component system, OmpR family, sensor histidine kinase AdeS [Trinickia caryophylli]GLU31948.1 two-component sensor histidine kinase [Trinickia caryophylli]
MPGRSKLSRQIVASMGLVSAITTLIAFVGSFLIYGLLYTFWPPAGPPEDMFIPEAPDYLIFAAVLFVGLVIAVILALRLARRILIPLNSLAEGAQRIANGDLAARAVPGDRSLGETAHLVDDFNAMATKLQDMAADMAAWNAAIAHELRTPLTVLRGRLQGLAEGVFQPDENLFRGLLFQVEGLSRLVDDLRVVTLQDSGHLEMRVASIDIGAEVRRAVDSIRQPLEQAGLSVELSISPTVVTCDGARIRQALLALLDNARRYASAGVLRVQIIADDDYVVVRVEDDGPGLPPEFEPQAFEPFTRGDASRSRDSGGSGLGLSVVRAIALAHAGHARYRRSANGGSVFEIAIPRKHG